MKELSTPMPDVHLINNIPQTTSLNIAAVFMRPHKDVLNSIKQMSCSAEFRERNFSPSYYFSEQNKEMPMFEMTRDGFFFLVMGFTGAKAAAFKEAYIKAFNRMESELAARHELQDGQSLAELESRYQKQLINQQTQLIQMTSEAYQLAKDHIRLLKSSQNQRTIATYDLDSNRPDRFIRQVVNALKLYPNLNKTQLLAECGYSKDDKTARNWLEAFTGEHWYCMKRSGVFTYNLNVEALRGELV